jgi:hypothetical protein
VKVRLRYSRRGWSKFLFKYRTGSIMTGSGFWVPYVDPRGGVPWPPVIECWSEPKPTAAQALAF